MKRLIMLCLVSAALLGCQNAPRGEVRPEDLEGFGKPKSAKAEPSVTEAKTDRPASEAATSGSAPNATPGVPVPERAPNESTSQTTPNVRRGEAPVSVAPGAVAQDSNSMRVQRGNRAGRRVDRTFTSDFKLENGAEAKVLGVIQVDGDEVTAWNADGSPNEELKTQAMAAILDRSREASDGPPPRDSDADKTVRAKFVLIEVTTPERGSSMMPLPNLSSVDMRSFRAYRILNRAFRERTTAGSLVQLVNVSPDDADISVRFSALMDDETKVQIPLKSGTRAKLGQRDIVLTEFKKGAPPNFGAMGGSAVGYFELPGFNEDGTAFQVAAIGKDGQRVDLIDRDGKPMTIEQFSSSVRNEQRGSAQRENRRRSMPSSPVIIAQIDGKSFLILRIEPSKLRAVEVSVRSQMLVERTNIASQMKR